MDLEVLPHQKGIVLQRVEDAWRSEFKVASASKEDLLLVPAGVGV